MPICPYHGNFTPCRACYEKNMGFYSWLPPAVLAVPRPVIPHTHGSARPCKIRCGVNEGLCVLNTQNLVDYLFTDGLTGCTQVIFRSANATFTCHLGSSAPAPDTWTAWALQRFIAVYGAPTASYVITGDNPGMGNTIEQLLSGGPHNLVPLTRVTGCGGYRIDIATGAASPTPTGWNTARLDVSGPETGMAVIAARYIGAGHLGQPEPGDYYESCPRCGQLNAAETLVENRFA